MNEDYILKKMGERLRQMRINAGHTAYDKFAFTFDFDPQTILRAEQGKNITLRTLIKILDVHNVSLGEFFQDL